MKYLVLTGVLIAFFSLAATQAQPTSMPKPAMKYSPNDWKKESEDVKSFGKLIKEWSGSIKKPNPDYLNTLYGRLMEKAYKEHNELSSRISERSRKMHSNGKMSSQDSLMEGDKPKAYNPELKDQPMRVTKEDILQQKTESDYLAKYVKVVKAEAGLLQQLKTVKPFQDTTAVMVYGTVTNHLKDFHKQMNEELALMKLETSKK